LAATVPGTVKLPVLALNEYAVAVVLINGVTLDPAAVTNTG
jgi:hypothetical protein